MAIDEHRTGYKLEADVKDVLKKLEEIGFARDVRLQDHVKDRGGNTRKIDISFILVTWAVEILVSVECKAKGRTISLDDVDQLKTFKQELPERNIFWLVYDGAINDSVRRALKSHGISTYSKAELTEIVESIVRKYARSSIQRQRDQTRMLSMLSPQGYGMSAMLLKRTELGILSKLLDVVAMLKPLGSYYHQGYDRE